MRLNILCHAFWNRFTVKFGADRSPIYQRKSHTKGGILANKCSNIFLKKKNRVAKNIEYFEKVLLGKVKNKHALRD